jgi:hypothetical protein
MLELKFRGGAATNIVLDSFGGEPLRPSSSHGKQMQLKAS